MGKEAKMEAVMEKDSDLRDKIKTFMVKLDKMEERVKEVETLTSSVPKLEAKLSKVILRVEKIEQRVESDGKAPKQEGKTLNTPPPVKAFVSGASIGLLLIGAIIAAWFLGLL